MQLTDLSHWEPSFLVRCSLKLKTGDQFKLSYLITNLKIYSTQTTACTVSFGNEQYQSTYCFYSSL